MTSIHVVVSGVKCEATKTGPLTRGMIGVPVTFEFNEVWDDLTITAVFRAGPRTIDVLDIKDYAEVPWELLTEEHDLYVGLFGVNSEGTLVIPTLWAYVGATLPGADPSGDVSASPSLPVWQDIIHRTEAAEQKVNEIPDLIDDALTEAKESGEFKGDKGDRGDKGEKGDKGDDYSLTNSDKKEIADLVEAAVAPVINDLKAHQYDAFATEYTSGYRTVETDLGADNIPPKQMRIESSGNVYFQQMTIRRLGKNLLNPNEEAYEVGKVIQEDGTPKSNAGYATTVDYLPVRANTDYVFSGRIVGAKTYNFVVFYDSNRKFISRFKPEKGRPAQFRTPSYCAYIKYCVSSTLLPDFSNNDAMLEVGKVASFWEAYNAKDYVVKLPRSARWYKVDVLNGTCRDVFGKTGTFTPIDVRTQRGYNHFYVIHSENYRIYATAYLDPTLMYNKLKTAIVAAGSI